jgi:hypothetical protein
MQPLDAVLSTKEKYESKLLALPGVTGVDVGYKYVSGKKTDEISIRVFVDKKHDVVTDEVIPRDLDGVKTDVIERRFVLHVLSMPESEISAPPDPSAYDRLQGGISIGPCRQVGGNVYAGTLGAVVIDNASGAPVLLSNFHVMCIDSGWHVGDAMCQPSRLDGGTCAQQTVGRLSRARLGGQVDCAIATHDSRLVGGEILEIGQVMGISSVSLGLRVRKRGRTTRLTYGFVDGVGLTTVIDYGDGLGHVTLTNQIHIAVNSTKSVQWADHGDSGSVVVDDASRIIGLHYGGSADGKTGVANPVQSVFNALGVHVQSIAGHAWQSVPGSATEIGVGAEGTAWVCNEQQQIFRWTGGGWQGMPGDAVRVDVGPDGNAWVCNSQDQIFRWTSGGWQAVPGAATDVGVGSSGVVWVCNAQHQIFRWTGGGWQGMPGDARRIDVDPSGHAWVCNTDGKIFRWTGTTWARMPGVAVDISVGPDGTVWIVGAAGAILRWNGINWHTFDGDARAISVGPQGLPWVVNSKRQIFRRI